MCSTSSNKSLKNDIAASIYFAANIHPKPRHRVALPSLKPEYCVHSGRVSNLEKVLDSIALLCVSHPRLQVFAVGLRVTRSEVELVVAENGEISSETIQHLRRMWESLQALAKKLDEQRRTPAISRRHQTKYQDSDIEILIQEFHEMSLKFVVAKLRRRVSKHQMMFIGKSFTEKHILYSIGKCIILLNRFLLEENALNEDKWELVMYYLTALQHTVDTMADDDFKDHKRFMPSAIPSDFSVQKCLSKIISIPRAINVLLMTAKLPRLRHIFNLQLIITPANLNPQGYTLPATTLEWKQVFSRLLNEKNRTKKKGEAVYELTNRAKKNAQRFSKKFTESPFVGNDVDVHCVCRITQHTLQAQTSPIYPYIGMSKFSCKGCWEYIQAVNVVNGTKLRIKGHRNKWVFPWAFASIPKKDKVAAEMFTNVARQIGRHYHAFRKMKSTKCNIDTQSRSANCGSKRDEVTVKITKKSNQPKSKPKKK